MERIWLKSYPPGVPAEVDYRSYKSLGDLFEKSVAQYRGRAAFHSMGTAISFGELDKLTRDFGAWLQAKGLPKGARVPFIMPTCLLFPSPIFAPFPPAS